MDRRRDLIRSVAKPQQVSRCIDFHQRCVAQGGGKVFGMVDARSSLCKVPHVARSMPGGKTAYAIRRPRRSGQGPKLVGHIKITRGTSSE